MKRTIHIRSVLSVMMLLLLMFGVPAAGAGSGGGYHVQRDSFGAGGGLAASSAFRLSAATGRFAASVNSASPDYRTVAASLPCPDSTLANPAKLVLVLSTAGTMGNMAAIDLTMILPAGVTVEADPYGTVGPPALIPSGQGVGSIFSARYTPATATTPGTVRIVVLNPNGFPAGEFARLTCDVTDGGTPDPSAFLVTMIQAEDPGGAPISGMTAGVTLPSDTDPPLLILSTLVNGAVTGNATLNVTGNLGDAGGGGSLAVNGVAVAVAADGSFSYALPLAAGANTVTTIATDHAGNRTADARTVTLDRGAPLLTVAAPADNSRVSRSFIDVTGTVGENSTVTVNGAFAAINGTTYSATANLAAGLNTIEITAVDLAGNRSSAKRTVISDTGASSLAITEPAQDITTTQSSITVRGTVADALTPVTVTVSVNGESYTPPVTDGSFSQSISFGSQKSYAALVTATDETGNRVTVQRNIIYRIDKAGDCDGDGSVSIAEVQSAINMFLGLKQVAGCVDVDNNSSVSIAEVQKTINSFLGL